MVILPINPISRNRVGNGSFVRTKPVDKVSKRESAVEATIKRVGLLKNQNSWYRIGSLPPARSKKDIFKF